MYEKWIPGYSRDIIFINGMIQFTKEMKFLIIIKYLTKKLKFSIII